MNKPAKEAALKAPASFKTIALIGGGLIGSSLARAIRQFMPESIIVMSDRDPQVVSRLKELQLAHRVELDSRSAVQGADLVILCVPVGVCADVAKGFVSFLKEGCVLSDVGSVKASVLDEISPHVPENVHFVPAHPVAGTEHSGPDAGKADLFVNRWTILTPADNTPSDNVARLEAFWQALGSTTEVMTARHHDLVLAVTSHLPHLIAYNIVGTADDLETVTQSEVIKFSAGGFRDFTRIAASDPVMWRDIFLHNKEAVLEMLARFSEDLSLLQRAIRWGDGDTLINLFTRTRAIRRSVIESGQDTDAPSFGRD
jgi:cyclohexadieny/prephenate dehydrogenase